MEIPHLSFFLPTKKRIRNVLNEIRNVYTLKRIFCNVFFFSTVPCKIYIKLVKKNFSSTLFRFLRHIFTFIVL